MKPGDVPELPRLRPHGERGQTGPNPQSRPKGGVLPSVSITKPCQDPAGTQGSCGQQTHEREHTPGSPSILRLDVLQGCLITEVPPKPLEVQLELGLVKEVLRQCFLLFPDSKKSLNIDGLLVGSDKQRAARSLSAELGTPPLPQVPPAIRPPAC